MQVPLPLSKTDSLQHPDGSCGLSFKPLADVVGVGTGSVLKQHLSGLAGPGKVLQQVLHLIGGPETGQTQPINQD